MKPESSVGGVADIKELRTLAEPKGYNVEAVFPTEGNVETYATYSIYPKGVSSKWGEHFPTAAGAREYIKALPDTPPWLARRPRRNRPTSTDTSVP